MLRIIIIFILTCQVAHAQLFRKSYAINLPDSIVAAKIDRADFNNDGLLDVILVTTSSSQKTYLQWIKGDTTLTPFLDWRHTRTIGPHKKVVLTDYNHDNRMDVVLSTTTDKVAVYLNNGDFSFSETLLSLPAFSELLIIDIDDDSRSEWILSDRQSGDDKLKVFRQSSSFTWSLVYDSILVSAAALAMTDQNYDGRTDVLVSGAVGTDSVVTLILRNDGKLHLTRSSAIGFSGNVSSADINSDGVFDFLLMGSDRHTDGSRIYQSSAGEHRSTDIGISLQQPTPFIADFNSDGIVDFNYQGSGTSGVLNVIQYASNNFDTISSAGYRAHIFGDEDRDGDLDLIVLTYEDRLRIQAYESLAAANKIPSSPKNAIVTRIYNRLFYYWDPSTDDRTPLPSITYDLYIDGTTKYAAEFDLLNEKRLTVTHGNNGAQNFKLLSANVPLQFAVQAVDNAFNSSRTCIGSSSGCAITATRKIVLCEGEKQTLKAPRESLWFSFANGFLGRHAALELSAANDTIFYYDPSNKGCDALTVLQLQIGNNGIRNVFERYACAGQSLHLDVETGWKSVSWRSYRRGNLGTGNSINFVATEPDTVTATMVSATGCTKIDKTIVKLSTPLVVVSPDQVRIPIGSDVQLTASGASQYEWRPASGLSSANVADPVAAPLATTTYTVSGTDSLGCVGVAQAIVYVENGGYVPNLFTPNGDGKNDEIRIYGLSEASDFMFTIHNREGVEVYRSTNLTEASQKGWDGAKKGVGQPAGVYFWKVKGKLRSGERLLLNGKDSGSIVLVR